MPIEIRELHIKAVIAPEADALMSFGADASAARGGHAAGVNMAFAAEQDRPAAVEILALNVEKIAYATSGADGLDLVS